MNNKYLTYYKDLLHKDYNETQDFIDDLKFGHEMDCFNLADELQGLNQMDAMRCIVTAIDKLYTMGVEVC